MFPKRPGESPSPPVPPFPIGRAGTSRQAFQPQNSTLHCLLQSQFQLPSSGARVCRRVYHQTTKPPDLGVPSASCSRLSPRHDISPNHTSSCAAHPQQNHCSQVRIPRITQLPYRVSLPPSKKKMTANEPREDWQKQPPYRPISQDPGFAAKHTGSCHCGRVRYSLSRDRPLSSKYCHCRDCQALHGT